MEKYELEAIGREVIGKKVKALRREGFIPAIIYGFGIEPIPIKMKTKEVHQILRVIGANTLVTLKIGKKEHLVLVRDIQREVISRDLLHMDFQEVSLEENITSTVPILLIGDAPAVKEFEALLITNMEEIQIEAKAKDLPDTISVDITTLREIGDNILVKDLVIAGDVTVLDDPEDVVIVATLPVLMAEIEELVEEGAELFEELTDAELMEEGVEGVEGVEETADDASEEE